ncbi:MAG: hypothetical protein D6753_09975 [Planctomycetota bacterium]|nr:MAG: hypothetical protein D6753_09975 [Planctomycetota bacterium]
MYSFNRVFAANRPTIDIANRAKVSPPAGVSSQTQNPCHERDRAPKSYKNTHKPLQNKSLWLWRQTVRPICRELGNGRFGGAVAESCRMARLPPSNRLPIHFPQTAAPVKKTNHQVLGT